MLEPQLDTELSTRTQAENARRQAIVLLTGKPVDPSDMDRVLTCSTTQRSIQFSIIGVIGLGHGNSRFNVRASERRLNISEIYVASGLKSFDLVSSDFVAVRDFVDTVKNFLSTPIT